MRWIWRYFGDAGDSDRRAILLQRTLALCGLLLLAATWPLWTPGHVFPQVPLVRAALLWPIGCQWIGTACIAVGLAGALILPSRSRWASGALVCFAVSMLALVIFDQERFQPWAYQFVLVALVLAFAEPPVACALVRLLVVSFYFHSALSKFDTTFLNTLGQQFLAALAAQVGLSLEGETTRWRLAAAAVFPLGELLIAAGLCFRRTRGVALAGAVLLHVLLLLILGPWGLNHKPGVLLWNFYFIVQDVLLFWGVRPAPELVDQAVQQASHRSRIPWPLATLWIAAILLPFLAPWGWFDVWPAWALYAPNAERVSLLVHRREAERLPAGLQPFLEPVADDTNSDGNAWVVLRLDRWSLAALGAPIYPQNRVQLGIAEAVIAEYNLGNRARVVRLGLADRWSGQRQHDVLSGDLQIMSAADRYFFNARPRLGTLKWPAETRVAP